MRKFHQDNSEIDLGIFLTRGLMLREDYCKEDYNMNKIQNDDVTNIMKYKGDHNTNKVKIRQFGRYIVYTYTIVHNVEIKVNVRIDVLILDI